MGRFVRWRFDRRRFPAGSPARSVALHILKEIETPNKVEEKLRDALGAPEQKIVRHRAEAEPDEPPLPLLELPPQTPEPPPAATSRPGG